MAVAVALWTGERKDEGMRVRGEVVPPDRYLATTREYLDKCGWDARVGVIVDTMREDGVAVGYWLNPCLNYLTGSDYSISQTQLPEGFPLQLAMVNGKLTVIRP